LQKQGKNSEKSRLIFSKMGKITPFSCHVDCLQSHCLDVLKLIYR